MKGKYAARATLRREDAGVRSEIESYQHAVKRLTAENGELKAKLAAAQDEHRNETRRLRAERDEGLSPEVAALREELRRQRERAEKAAAVGSEAEKRYGWMLQTAALVLHNATGCTGVEATEKLMAVIGNRTGGGGPAMIIDQGAGADIKLLNRRTGDRHVMEQARTLQRTRGYRSGPEVVERLNSVMRGVADPP